MRGATDEPISPEIEHAAARRTVEAHAARGYCGPACAPDPGACTQIGWARGLLAGRTSKARPLPRRSECWSRRRSG
jgi:hypothetical protein